MAVSTEEDGGWWESTKYFEVIPGETSGTQPWFIALSIVGYLASLYFLTDYMEKRQPIKLKMVTAIHKFALI